jgi:HEAT repeat protein
MKTKRFRIVLVFLLAAVVGGFAWQVLGQRDRLVQGKPESFWISTLTNRLVGTDAENWRALGPDAIPVLCKALESGASPWDRAYGKIWPKLPSPLQRRLHAPEDAHWLRCHAASVLRDIGDGSKIAIPALQRALRDENFMVRMNVAGAVLHLLPSFGADKDQFLSALLRALQDSHPSVRANVALCLKYFRDHAGTDAPALVKALQDPDGGVRILAAGSLYEVDPDAAARAEVVPLLVNNLTDARFGAAAARTLGKIAKEPGLVVPALTALLTSGTDYVRETAVVALGQFGTKAENALPELIRTLDDTNPRLRTAATNALKAIDPEAAAKAGVK